ncbi:MAG: aldehyde dehydrogenase family protein [Halioglobus sp.]|nr:aldehyde dehydrogenase family protein [Halioglobus sp.]
MSNQMTKLREVFELQKKHQWRVRTTNSIKRIEKLGLLKSRIRRYEDEIRQACYEDLKQNAEMSNGQISATYSEIDEAIVNLESWMSPVDVEATNQIDGSRAYIRREARGIVLLFGPWNFPFSLVFQPLVSIISAGNCALVKPNELAPRTSAVTSKIIREAFAAEHIAVFEGGVDLANEMLELPVNHIFFTGSPVVGKAVMAAAAVHLASVTLELGGKNPVIVDRSANIEDAAGKIVATRNVNCGQVCLCPENIWIHQDCMSDFIKVARATVDTIYYEDNVLNMELTGKIINSRNLSRIEEYLTDARDKGAVVVYGGQIDTENQVVHPTMLTDVDPDAVIIKEEVFGPILTLFTYEHLNEVYESLHNEPTPLALYIFSENDAFIEDVLKNTNSGGVTINNCMLHVGEPNLPFGGVNGSGIGRYRGIHGFKELSHERSVLQERA